MSGAGILPVSVDDRGQVVFLLGKERWDSRKWSSFGGRVEPGETLVQTAYREGYEETMGILGNTRTLKSFPHAKYFTKGGLDIVLLVPYDKDLPLYFDRFFQYALEAKATEPGYFEKSEIGWFDKKRLRQFERQHKLRAHFEKELNFLYQLM